MPPGTNVKGASREECDVTSPGAVDTVVEDFHPDVVINTAGYTAVDQAEDAPGEAFAVNAGGARNIAAAAKRAGARIIHISTDYVFDGRRSTPYPPEAKPNPLSVYGASKLAGEREVAEAAPDAVIVRCGWLYGARGKGFLNTVLSRASGRETLRVVDDQVGVPTSAREFAEFIWWLVASPGHSGLMHWANSGQATRYQFAKAIAEIALEQALIERLPQIEPVATSDIVTKASRPAYSVLDATDSWRAMGRSAAPWRDALASTLDEIAVARA